MFRQKISTQKQLHASDLLRNFAEQFTVVGSVGTALKNLVWTWELSTGTYLPESKSGSGSSWIRIRLKGSI